MAQQNIYDNEVFFEGYQQIRAKEGNANVLFEMPALFSMLPDLNGKTVLDLGCGFGEHCMYFAKKGAIKVVGIDISEKMLKVAKTENGAQNIIYHRMAMENISELDEYFDVVISSLAFHYVEDFKKLIQDCFDLLKPGGVLIFSQEHPFSSAFGEGRELAEMHGKVNGENEKEAKTAFFECPRERWTKDENGRKLYVNLANYGIEGERKSKWFVEGVQKYHRTFSTIFNDLAQTGFFVEKVEEPLPTPDILEKYPEQADLFHKPDFLVIKARKVERRRN